MPDIFNRQEVSSLLNEADEQLNIYAGGAFYTQEVFPEHSISLQSPEDWLAWIIRDAVFYERLARERGEELGFLWEEATLLRRFAQRLTDMGVHPSPIEWPNEHTAMGDGNEPYFYLMVDARARAWKRRKGTHGWKDMLLRGIALFHLRRGSGQVD